MNPARGTDAGRIVTVLAAVEEGEKSWVVTLDPKTSRWEKITPGSPGARLSPDGTTVAFGSGTGLWICPLKAGARARRIGEAGDPEAMELATLAIAWSPDGRSLIATGTKGAFPETTHETFRFDLRGGAPVKLKVPETDAIDDVNPHAPWLLTSREIGAISRGVYRMRPDGSGEVSLAPAGAFCGRFSPDGTKVLYTAYTGAGGASGGLYVVGSDGSNRRKVHPFPALGCWSPDGKRIALTGLPGPPVRIEEGKDAAKDDESRLVGRIALIDPDGKNRTVYPTPGEVGAFAPDWR